MIVLPQTKVVRVSHDRKTGPVSATYRPVGDTCPPCSLAGNGCYAERGRVNIHQRQSAEETVDLDNAAADLLRHLPLRSQAARDQVSLVWRRLAMDVHMVGADASAQIEWHRLNRHYQPAVELGQLLLRNGSVAIAEGGLEVPSFVVNMNEVFEDFVVAALQDAMRTIDRGLVLDQGPKRRGLALDVAKKIRLVPDISVWRVPACVDIADVKYKRVNAAGVKHPDIYQLLSYLVSTDLAAGMLIYAKGEADPALHRVVNIDRDLEVVAVDLEQESDDVLDQIDRIAERLVGGTA